MYICAYIHYIFAYAKFIYVYIYRQSLYCLQKPLLIGIPVWTCINSHIGLESRPLINACICILILSAAAAEWVCLLMSPGPFETLILGTELNPCLHLLCRWEENTRNVFSLLLTRVFMTQRLLNSTVAKQAMWLVFSNFSHSFLGVFHVCTIASAVIAGEDRQSHVLKSVLRGSQW